MSTKITESQLRDSTARLREYMAQVEGAQQNEDAAGVGQAIGQAVGGAAGVAAAVPRAGAEVAQGIANNAGKWWDAAKQGVSNFAGGVAQGAQQGWAATDPAKLVGGGSAAAPAGTTLKSPQEIMAFQKANGLTPDGIVGPKTQAAMKAKGVTSAAKPAAPVAKPAAPVAQAGQAAAPAGTTTPAAPAAVPGQMAGGQVVDTRGGIGGQEEMEESVSFKEINRLVSLVQYR